MLPIAVLLLAALPQSPYGSSSGGSSSGGSTAGPTLQPLGQAQLLLGPGGQNQCSSGPTAIFGTGTFPFDTSSATTGSEGQNETLCNFFAGSTVANDVWFRWTANGPGTAVVSTCASTLDTRLAAYPGGSNCPLTGSALDCDDDGCGFQSRIDFPVQAGSSYLIQIGNFPGFSGGPGTFDIHIQGSPNGYCPSDGSSEVSVGLTLGGAMGWLQYFETSGASDTIQEVSAAFGTLTGGAGNLDGLGVTAVLWNDPTNDANPADVGSPLWTSGAGNSIAGSNFDAWQCFAVSPGVNVQGGFWVGFIVTHSQGRFPAALDQSLPSFGLSWLTSDSGSFDFTLQNNDGPPQDVDQVGSPGRWLVQVNGACGPCGSGDQVDLCAADGTSATACPCGNQSAPGSHQGCVNTTGNGARLALGGPTSLSNSSFVLTVTGATANQFGIVFSGTNRPEFAFGDGLRCVGQNVRRSAILSSSGTGTYGALVNTPGATLQLNAEVGSRRYAQGWYRDPGGPCGSGFNLSTAASWIVRP